MPFDLLIRFRGLCCFVAQPSQQRMYVLMPKTQPSAVPGTYGSTVMQHNAILSYLQAYETSGAAGFAKYPIVSGDVLLPDYSSGQNSASQTLDATIAPIATLIPDAFVWDGLLTADVQPDVVVARVMLTSGQMVSVCTKHRWTLGSMTMYLAYCADWLIPGINDTTLRWVITPFHGGPSQSKILNPVSDSSGRNTIELHVSHVMDGEDPENYKTWIDDPTMQIHFQAFYDLFSTPPATAYYPICDEANTGCKGTEKGGRHAAGASTCALAGGRGH